MMSSAVVFVKTFRATRKPFRARAKTVRLPVGITVRLQPGILFVFTPESFSRSPRNPFRLAPESALCRITMTLSRSNPCFVRRSLKSTDNPCLPATVADGVDIATVSERLGHSSVRVTAEIYSHALRGRDDEAAQRWEQFQRQHGGSRDEPHKVV
jgi:integrase